MRPRQPHGDLAVRLTAEQKIVLALGRIEGELVEIRKLSQRVAKLEQWQSWLRGGWSVLVIVIAYFSMTGR